VSAVRRSFVAIEGGHIHYAEAGAGNPVLLLHQTPRSWDEYRDVLPLLGARCRAIAMDTIGFGDSSKPGGPGTVEGYAEAVLRFLDALGLERVSLVGHHTGGVIAFELAASHPERVDRLVLSSTPLVDDAFRRERELRPAPDDVRPDNDGSHLLELWQGRLPFYPPGRRDLLERFVVDALKAGTSAHGGHMAVRNYDMTAKLALVRAPTLLIGATDDPFAIGHLEPLAACIAGSRTVLIEGGTVPLPDHLPEDFARAVLDFLDP